MLESISGQQAYAAGPVPRPTPPFIMHHGGEVPGWGGDLEVGTMSSILGQLFKPSFLVSNPSYDLTNGEPSCAHTMTISRRTVVFQHACPEDEATKSRGSQATGRTDAQAYEVRGGEGGTKGICCYEGTRPGGSWSTGVKVDS